MGKKMWIAFGITCVAIVVLVIALILVIVPQDTFDKIQTPTYDLVAREDYTYSGKTTDSLDSTKEYVVTASDLNKGLKTEKFKEGNINPFTPKHQVTVYNEPTLMEEYERQNGSGSLTPNDK